MKTTTTCAGCGKAIPEAIAGDALCTACRYHDAPHKTGSHADNPAYVAAIETVAANLPEPEPEEWQIEFRERMANFLDWLAGTGNVTHAGRRAVILAHLAGKGPFRTDADAAGKLNMTPARLSQIRAEIEAFWPGFTGNRRQKMQPRNNGKRASCPANL